MVPFRLPALLAALGVASALHASPPARADTPCLGRVHAGLLKRYGDLPIATLFKPDFPGIGEPIVVPPWYRAKLGIRKITKVEQIGDGGYGTVFRVKVDMLDGSVREMAWKEITREDHGSLEKDGMTLQYMASRAADGQASYVVPVHGRFRTRSGERHAYLMDLAGRSAHSLMYEANAPLRIWKRPGSPVKSPGGPLRLLARMLHDVSSALAQQGKAGILHKDLKLANIVRDGDGFRLIDYGIATPEDVGPLLVSGTPGYMGPEKYLEAPPPDTPATDIYSLAVVAAEVLTGMELTDPRIRATTQHWTQGKYNSDLLSAEKVRAAIEAHRKALESAPVPPTAEELTLYDALGAFAVRGLNPDPVARLSSFRTTPSPFLRVSDDGRILGPAPALLQKLRK